MVVAKAVLDIACVLYKVVSFAFGIYFFYRFLTGNMNDRTTIWFGIAAIIFMIWIVFRPRRMTENEFLLIEWGIVLAKGENVLNGIK